MALTDKTLMAPPWIKEHMFSQAAMGSDASYLSEFSTWYEGLSQEEQQEYQTLFPEPATWSFYASGNADIGDASHGGLAQCCADVKSRAWQKDGLPKYSHKWLKQKMFSDKSVKMFFFWGHKPSANGAITKSCLSQWWPCDFTLDGESYKCMEQWMMAGKAQLFEDAQTYKQILSCEDPGKIKALGRKVKNFDDRKWDKFKHSIVLNGNYYKFAQNKELRRFLLATGDKILVEASPHDNIWGIGLADSDKDSRNVTKWRGQNMLGFALMEVRDELRRVYANEHLLKLPN